MVCFMDAGAQARNPPSSGHSLPLPFECHVTALAACEPHAELLTPPRKRFRFWRLASKHLLVICTQQCHECPTLQLPQWSERGRLPPVKPQDVAAHVSLNSRDHAKPPFLYRPLEAPHAKTFCCSLDLPIASSDMP